MNEDLAWHYGVERKDVFFVEQSCSLRRKINFLARNCSEATRVGNYFGKQVYDERNKRCLTAVEFAEEINVTFFFAGKSVQIARERS